ncbi:hypothetical protein BJ508DRAFT_380748 [Ascobolus immersus RN42]|uniref:Uncharacterized protein n=1 Tax=Ascobolus immersus RN42 TaxID=1160509 RepID=A0A3N4HJM6_ASCIM|nr:hypothetical protein BJ508DRAFT_380748 [Ascobolus immersus RN42]
MKPTSLHSQPFYSPFTTTLLLLLLAPRIQSFTITRPEPTPVIPELGTVINPFPIIDPEDQPQFIPYNGQSEPYARYIIVNNPLIPGLDCGAHLLKLNSGELSPATYDESHSTVQSPCITIPYNPSRAGEVPVFGSIYCRSTKLSSLQKDVTEHARYLKRMPESSRRCHTDDPKDRCTKLDGLRTSGVEYCRAFEAKTGAGFSCGVVGYFVGELSRSCAIKDFGNGGVKKVEGYIQMEVEPYGIVTVTSRLVQRGF